MKFVFYVPPYTKLSGGIWFCHFLAEQVEKKGHSVRKVYFGDVEKLAEDEIAFYPEVVPDNPLGAKKIIRGLLNKDGLLCGEKVGRENNEFVFTYSRLYDKDVFLLFYPICEEVEVNLNNLSRRMLSICFNGKNPNYSVPEGLKPPLFMMNRDWPSLEMTLELLKQARVLYSSDCWTALLTQALWCGCAPVITDFRGWTLEECVGSELPEPFQLNAEEDMSDENILKKRENLVQTIKGWKEAFPATLDIFLQKISDHFAMKEDLCLESVRR